MAIIKWSEDYSVKIESIDKQHKVLVDMINEFNENIKTESYKALIGDLIKKMKEYAIFHFTTEEDLFKKYNFSDYETHKYEHDDFAEKVVSLEKRFLEGKMVLSFEITDFLKNWLLNHIQGTDMKYSKFLREKGVV